jgi:hypothetical protein
MPRMRRTRRRVLRGSPMEQDFAIYVESRGWPEERSVPRDVSAAVDHEVLWRATEGVLFDYLEAYLTGDACVLGLSLDLQRAEKIMESVESDFEGIIFEQDELLDRIEMSASPQELARALIRAGLGAPLRYDKEFFDLIVGHATSHSESRIREIAICSMVYTEWPEFLPVLRRIVTSDPETRVRDRAQILLTAYRSAGIGGDS